MGHVDIQSLLTNNGPIEELELDEVLEDHLRERGTYPKHDVSLSEIIQVLQRSPKLFANTSTNGRAPVIMVGPTNEGRMLCIPIEPTGKWGVWRPVTAFEANNHHRERYRRE